MSEPRVSPLARGLTRSLSGSAAAATVALRGSTGTAPLEISVLIRTAGGKEAKVNGTRVASAERLRDDHHACLHPDRLSIVKGPPPRSGAPTSTEPFRRLLPARSALPFEYAGGARQRNASLRRVATGLAQRDSLDPWTARVAELAGLLVEARRGCRASLECVRSAWGRLRPGRRNPRLRGEGTLGGGAAVASRPGSGARDDGSGPTSRRRPGRFAAPATFAASAHRASSALQCCRSCWARSISSPPADRHPRCCSTTCFRNSTVRAGPRSPGACHRAARPS